MKKTERSKSMRTIRTFIMAAFIATPMLIMTQTPPHPNGGSAPGSGDPPVGSPIGGGLIIMMVLGATYGAKNVYDLRKKD